VPPSVVRHQAVCDEVLGVVHLYVENLLNAVSFDA
jgi:hypothetical protein